MIIALSKSSILSLNAKSCKKFIKPNHCCNEQFQKEKVSLKLFYCHTFILTHIKCNIVAQVVSKT